MRIPRMLASHAAQTFKKYPVITLTGPRQSGKTTLVKSVFDHLPYTNLERPDIRDFATQDPLSFLNQYPNGAIFDEIQRVPDLLSYIQVAVDEADQNGLFVLTGSHQFELMQNVSQSLAGRTALLKLLPLSQEELKDTQPLDKLLYTGFYPRIHDQNMSPTQALSDYYGTYIERDLRQLIQIKDLSTFETFVKLCAGRVGHLLNLNSLANDVGISHTTAREWINILQASYIVYLLRPYHTTTSKRLIKSPKLYFYDVGLATHLCGIENEQHISNHPLKGHFFENLVVMEALKYRLNRGLDPNLTFYRDSTGNEIDLLYPLGPNVLPIEIKLGQTISSDYFKGFKAFERFQKAPNTHAIVVYGGTTQQQRTQTTITPFHTLPDVLTTFTQT